MIYFYTSMQYFSRCFLFSALQHPKRKIIILIQAYRLILKIVRKTQDVWLDH